MKLSMSMLAWYLREYEPECAISNDKVTIQGIRFLSDEVVKPLPQYVYFSDAESYFTDPKYSGAILLVHGQSTMFFRGCEYQELLNVLLSAFEYFNSWEAQLVEAAAAQLSVQNMVDLSETLIGNPVVISDIDGGIFAATGGERVKQDHFWQYTLTTRTTHPAVIQSFFYDKKGNLIRDLSERPHLVQNVFPGGAPVIMLYLKQDDEVVGVTAILQENELLTTLNLQLAPILARYLIKAKEFSLPSGSVRSGSAIVKDLLEKKMVGEDNIKRLTDRVPAGPWRLLVFKHMTRNDVFAKKGLIREIQDRQFLYFPLLHEQWVVALATEADLTKLQREGSAILNLQNFCIGVSMPMANLSAMFSRYQQAKFAMEQSEAQAGIWLCEDFSFHYLLSILRVQELTPSLLHPALEQLEQYDKENQGELRQTISVYLKKEQNHVPAANELHIHTNTLKYRLRRIRELTGLTLTDEAELRYLQLSDWISNN